MAKSSLAQDQSTPTKLGIDPIDDNLSEAAAAPIQAPPPDASKSDFQQLAEAIIAATKAGQPKRVIIPFGQQNPTNAFNPTGKRGRKLHKPCYQNGYRLGTPDPDVNLNLTDEEIDLLAKVKSGRFIDGLVTVFERATDDGTGELHITFKDKTADQRMAIGARVGSFAGMLRLCLSEYEAQQKAIKAARKQEIEEALN